jgi:hypothetical protein
LAFHTFLHRYIVTIEGYHAIIYNFSYVRFTLFLYFVHVADFLQKLVKDKKIHEARAFNFSYRYIDDVLSINNSRFAEFLPLIYPPELEVKETTDTASSASCRDGIYFDKILVSEYKLFKRSNKANLLIALVQ